jgi:hypothetical protein
MHVESEQMRNLVLPILLFLTSCHPLFCSWHSEYSEVKTEPRRETVIGQYRLIQSSKEFLLKKGFSNQEFLLELKENGKFQFTDAPDIIFDSYGRTQKKLIEYEGKWALICGESYGCMIELENITVEPLAQKAGSLAILITIGDGDSCEGIVYEKIERGNFGTH